MSFHTDFFSVLEEDLLLGAWLSHLHVNVLTVFSENKWGPELKGIHFTEVEVREF